MSVISKIVNLPQEWLLPFLKDYIFYAIFICIFSTMFRHLGENASSDDRILLVCGGTWLWAWVLIAFYMLLQESKYIMDNFSLPHGLASEMRKKYALPKKLGEKLTFHDVKWNCLRNQIVYFGLAGGYWKARETHEAKDPESPGGNFTAPAAPLSEVLLSVILFMILFDIIISIGHQILHTHLYFWHKIHHSQRGSMPAGGWYMHIVDFFIELFIPIFVPGMIFRANWVTWGTWLFLVEWDGVHTHSALDLGLFFKQNLPAPIGGWLADFIPGPKRHWLHHMLYFCNYGPGLGDYFCETEGKEIMIRDAESDPKSTSLEHAVSKRKLMRSQAQMNRSQLMQSFAVTVQKLNVPTEFEDDDIDRVAFFHGMEVDENEPEYYTRISNVEERPGMSYIRMG